MRKPSDENQVVFRGLRRNGMLSYRPSLRQRKLVEGSHRMPSPWLKRRFDWRNEAGAPTRLDYSKRRGGGVKVLEDMADGSDGETGDNVALKSWGLQEVADDSVKSCLVEVAVELDVDAEHLAFDVSVEAMRAAGKARRSEFAMSSSHARQT
jgi:hypothetical protein